MTRGLTDTANNRVRDPGPAGPWVLVAVLLVIGLAAADLWAAITLSHLLDGTAGALPASVPDPLRAALEGRAAWTGTTTGILIALAVIEALLDAWVLSASTSGGAAGAGSTTRPDTWGPGGTSPR